MKILGIDTSCDETCVSVIERSKKSEIKILSNIVSSQIKIHAKYGGIVPGLAKREHQKNLTLVLKKSLKKAGLLQKRKTNLKIDKPKLEILKNILSRETILLKKSLRFLQQYETPDIDCVAITVGPGLEPALWSGVNFAKTLSFFWKKPIIPINHLEGHILANWLTPVSLNHKSEITNYKNIFPAVCLIASGGHTELVLMKKIGNYKLIGETRDDAAGECIDKIGKILGLPYPGGPAISKIVAKKTGHTDLKIKLPRPMINSKDYDFSFSGLKTAVLYNYKSQKPKTKKSENYIKTMCEESQQAIIDVLISKTKNAAAKFKVKTILLGGGVTANSELRRQMKKNIKKNLSMVDYMEPKIKFCADNAAMIGITGLFNITKKTKHWKEIEANANLNIYEL